MSERFVPIKTARLLIRALKRNDLEAVFMILGDEETTANVSWHQASLQSTSVWLERRIRNEEEHGYSMWAIGLASSGELIGLCGFFPMETGEIELGYVIHAKHQRKGYASEAVQEVVGEASARMLPVFATIRSTNAASIKVAEKAGLVQDGQMQDERGSLLVYRSRS